MKSKLDMETMVTAVGVAAYVAIAIAYLAHHVLGIVFQEIREAAVITAIVISVPILIDLVLNKPGRAK
jgi:hypothetical protein